MEHKTRHCWYRGKQYRKEHRHKETSGNDKWDNYIDRVTWSELGWAFQIVWFKEADEKVTYERKLGC